MYKHKNGDKYGFLTEDGIGLGDGQMLMEGCLLEIV